MSSYRPWGIMDWVLSKLPRQNWSLIGSVATGDRSLAVWSILKKEAILHEYALLKIHDFPDPLWGDASEQRLKERNEEFLSIGGRPDCVVDCHLGQAYEWIFQTTKAFIENAGPRIILDISTLPKRFFFPIVKVLVQSDRVTDFAITYTRPREYSSEPLAIDHEPWRSLPLFGPPLPEPPRRESTLIVGLGYELLGLPSMLRDESFRGLKKYSLFFPFPATPSGYARNWEVRRQLEKELGNVNIEHARVNAYDVSGIYESILTHVNNARDYAIFAPFGPKPMSIAMCLYCVYHEELSSAYYTQPRAYNPLYSSGVRMQRDSKEVYFYCVRLKGKNLYASS